VAYLVGRLRSGGARPQDGPAPPPAPPPTLKEPLP
jgi:hypothetical protein